MNLWQKLINPRNTWTSIQFPGIGHSWTPATFMVSIETLFSKITSPRYLIHSFWNLYFLECRNSLYLARISNTLQIVCICSFINLVKMRQTTTIPSAMRSQKILFIIVWKMTRLLVILKNITRGLNRLWLVQKVVFHSLLDLIYMLLNPHQISSLMKYLALQSCETSSEISKKGYLFLIVIKLSAQQSWTKQRELFFFLIKNTEATMENLNNLIYLVYRFSSRKVLSSLCSIGDKRYILEDLGSKPKRSLMVQSQWWCSRRMSKSFLANTISNSWA